MGRPTNTINLLTNSSYKPEGTLNRFSHWALTMGRWIVILTELVVIAAFLYRFQLDQKIADLKENIEEKRSVIQAYAAQEDRFRKTQIRLSSLTSALAIHYQFKPILIDLVKSLPVELAIKSININYLLENGLPLHQLTIQGIANNNQSVSSLITNLQTTDLFSDIRLTKVDLEGQTENLSQDLFQFNVTATINTQ